MFNFKIFMYLSLYMFVCFLLSDVIAKAHPHDYTFPSQCSCYFDGNTRQYKMRISNPDVSADFPLITVYGNSFECNHQILLLAKDKVCPRQACSIEEKTSEREWDIVINGKHTALRFNSEAFAREALESLRKDGACY